MINNKKNYQYYIQTFGCQMNERDSLLLSGLLEEKGYLPAASLAEAGIIIVNTCCVRESAENKIIGFLGNLKKNKKDNPSSVIAVCGCMSQKEGTAEFLMKKAPHIDIIIGTFALGKLADYIDEIFHGSKKIIDIEENYDNPNKEDQLSAAIKQEVFYKAQVCIIYGCNNFCSYCIVPYVRGRERSRRPEIIIQEIEQLAANGCKEVQLLGQNVNSYGKDLLDQGNFAQLLAEITKIKGLERIRFMTSHPRDFSDQLLAVIAENSKICKHIHLPVQSGCDRILKDMNRGYDAAHYLRILEKIRQACPDVAITSDLIIGYPGESAEDFQETLDFIQECGLDAAYTFLYSQRSGTPAAKLPNQIPYEIKKERLQALMAIQNPISLAINQKYLHKTLSVLVEGESKHNKEYFSGRSEHNKVVVFPKENAQIGTIIPVKITGAKTWNLYGQIENY
ncbi:MAG: tRNA (N6-isopentenyl adenosine(37)-C2)-methylthiotransferase MiaB [Clostridiales bacterium]